jgi:hypothetical protein
VIARFAFLLGMVGVPLVLLALGHNFRHRPPRVRSLFWGAAAGYLVGLLVATACAFLPPVDWTGGPGLRTVAVHWSAVLGPLLGAALTIARGGRGHDHEEHQPRHG